MQVYKNVEHILLIKKHEKVWGVYLNPFLMCFHLLNKECANTLTFTFEPITGNLYPIYIAITAYTGLS